MVTLTACLDGLLRQVGWWLQAFLRPRDPRAPLSPRRALILLVALVPMLLVQLVHVVCLLIDEVLFPGYRRVPPDRAIIITGIPRSGTTALHRALASDTARYTTPTTWEVLLAPSILQRRLVRAGARLDRALGGHARRGLTALTRRLAGDLAAVHEVALDSPEEDYLALLPAGGCFLLLLAFPGARGLQALGAFDGDMPAARRQRLLAFYRRLLQRHLYADGGQRILLSKNAAFGSWLRGLHATLPGARFIVCIREPVTALSSQISSVRGARMLGTHVDGTAFQTLFLDLQAGTLAHLHATLAEWPHERAAIVDMAELRAAPEHTVTAALEQLGEPCGDTLATGLAQLRGGGGGHRHSTAGLALATDTLAARLEPPYQALRALSHRVGGSA